MLPSILTLLCIAEILMLSLLYGETSQVINLRVDEESQIRTTIGNISAYLLPKSKFTIDQPFFTVTSTGMVQVARRINLESLCSEHTLCCRRDRACELTSSLLIESQSTKEIAVLELVVRVMDVNDNPPRFPTDRSGADVGQVVKISELAEVGSLLNLVPASDGDLSPENQVQRYAIHGVDFQGLFELDSSEPPNIRLRLLKPLDYETTQNYTGSLEAYDGKSRVQQKLMVLVIDANDNKPTFLKHSYTVNLPENTSVGETVLTLLATDNDSLPNARMDFHFYGATDPDLKKTFRLEKRTGNLILQSRLSAHQRTEFRFSVGVGEAAASDNSNRIQAADSLLHSSGVVSSTDVAQVVITVEDVNDFSPVIKMMSPSEGQPLVIRENEAPSLIAVFQVTDNDLQDNGRVQCHLVASSSAGNDETVDFFRLENRGKLFTLSTTKSFNAEVHPHLSVSIVCSDFGKPTRSSSRDLTIQVEDVNEFLPEVEKSTYYATVMENTKTGVEVVQVTARDRDHSAQLFYELSNEGKQYFAINQSTGMVTTLGDSAEARSDGAFGAGRLPRVFPNSVLDREKTERITFKVCITDGPATVPCGMTDSEQKSQSTSTAGQSSAKKPVEVIHTAYSTVFVTVLDENDNRPKFISTGPFSVMENQPRFTKVNGRLAAIDMDEGENGQVLYSLHQVWISAHNQPAPDLFQVDAEGVIRTMDVLDRELTNAYTLGLVACDSAPREPLCTGFNATVTVLDENDNKPVWHYPHDLDKEVNITSDLPPGHVIARVLAMDADEGDNGNVVYSLIDPNRRTVFQVDNRTGEVAVTKPTSDIRAAAKAQTASEVPENPLLPGVYRLRLRASDRGHPNQAAETWLQVNVFGSESVAGAGVNLFIIIIMISVTGAISACLVVAIICVRRRSSLYRTQRRNGPYCQGNSSRRIRGNRDDSDRTGANAYPPKHEYGYPLDGAGYVVMGVSPAPSDLGAMKLNSYHQAASSGLSLLPNGIDGHEPIPLLGHWTTTDTEHAAHCPHAPQGSDVGMSLLACPNHHDQLDSAGTSFSLPVYAPCPLTSPDSMMPVTATLMRTPPVPSSFSMHPMHYPTLASDQGLPTSSLDGCLRFSSPSPVPALGTLQTFRSPSENETGSHQANASDQVSSMKAIGTTVVSGTDMLRGPLGFDAAALKARSGYIVHPNQSACYHPTSRRYVTTGHPPQVSVCELDVDSADSGRGTSEDDPGQLGHHLMHFYPNLRLSHTTAAHHISSSGTLTVANCDGENPGRGEAAVGNWGSTDRPQLNC